MNLHPLRRSALALSLAPLFALACGDGGRGLCAVSDDACGGGAVAPAADGGAVRPRADGGPFVPAAPTNPLQTPTVVASGMHSPFNVALDDTSVFFTNSEEGTIYKTPRAGGAPVEIAREAPYARGLAVDGDRVYWVSGLPGTLRSVSKSGGPSKELGDANVILSVNEVVAFDETYIYWVHLGPDETRATGSIQRLSRTGITPEPIATGLYAPASLAVDATSVYWLQSNDFAHSADGTLHVSDKTGGAIRDLGSAGVHPGDLLLRGDYLYWTAEGTASGNGTLRRLAKTGGHTFTLASLHGLTYYAYVEGWLYFDGPDGRIFRVPSDGSTAPVPIADSSAFITAGVGGDASDVYFAVRPSRVANPPSLDGMLIRIEP